MSRRLAAVVGALASALVPGVALAHSAGGADGVGVASSLAAEGPGVVALLAIIAVPYVVGVRRLWARAGRGRGIAVREAASYGIGVSALALALLGPLFVPATDEFSGHMAQHLLLMVVAAPLLAFGQPARAFAWALRGSGAVALHSGHRVGRSLVVRAMTHPVTLLAIYVAVVWSWHAPALYDAAARNEALHALEHGMLLGVAFAFWWRVRTLALGPARRQVLAFFLLFAVMFPELVLGAFISFSSEPLYEPHRLATVARGGDPLMDQQLGGLAMLMLGGLAYAGVALAAMLRFLSGAERARSGAERGWEA
ncbi:MAG: cytochrome c oxidase assembly protein [Dehalococcoidia bacterium]|nr:cytochrome c oxidase assembly protein [Dehalococcoidia bacterium]MCB9490648.1 cytochrome c oxidase assembly protein [Dehalococcoidia bacterium]